MPDSSDEFYRIQKLPPYVFAVINEMRAKARAAQIDVIDLGMGNPDGATPRPIVNKLIEAARNRRPCMLPMPDAATFLNGLEDLYRTSKLKPKMLLISFPHNPTTTCVDLDYLREIVSLARH